MHIICGLLGYTMDQPVGFSGRRARTSLDIPGSTELSPRRMFLGALLALVMADLPRCAGFLNDFDYYEAHAGTEYEYDTYEYVDYDWYAPAPDWGDDLTDAQEEPPPLSLLETVQQRGHIVLGTYGDVPGFSTKAEGDWTGFEVDLGRAVAAAVLGNASKIEVSPVMSANRWNLLTRGKVDMLAAISTWTSERDSLLGISFPGSYFYDEQGIVVRKGLNISTLEDLAGKTIGMKIGTTSAVSLGEHFGSQSLDLAGYWVSTHSELYDVLLDGTVDAITADAATLQMGLCSTRSRGDQFQMLEARFGREPLSLAVAQGDQQWADIVRWVLVGMIQAEDRGLSSDNVDSILASCSCPSYLCMMLGTGGGIGGPSGLDSAWLYRVVKQVGNYGEVFDRHLGKQSHCCLPRGLNAPISKGGILSTPPLAGGHQ